MTDGAAPPHEPVVPTFAEVVALFRPRDVKAMVRFFDLASPVEVRAHAEEIWERVEGGTMPCDLMWQQSELDLFRRWMDGGMPD